MSTITAAFCMACAPGVIGDARDVPQVETPVSPLAGLAPAGLRRLTNAEYDSAIADLLGVVGASKTYGFSPDTFGDSGFDNERGSLGLSVSRAAQYAAAAEGVSSALIADATRRDAIAGCDPRVADIPCVRAFALRVARRAFRREPTDDELTRLLALAATAPSGAGEHGGVELVLRGLLQSPWFLFRVELGEPTDIAERRQLDGYELATRLSFLILGTSPDDALLDVARDGGLDTVDGIAATVRTLLERPEARIGLQRFAHGWLKLGEVLQMSHGSVEWTPELARASVDEVAGLFDRSVWEANDIGGILGAEVSPGRQGVLTSVAMLAMTGHGGDMLAPVLRGKYVREVVLCDDIPPPPGTPVPPEVPANATIRERWAPVEAEPGCGACHSLTNAIGHGFEGFDSLGRPRTVGTQGEALTYAGVLNIEGESLPFTGPIALSNMLLERSEPFTCVVKKLSTYANGGDVSDDSIIASNRQFVASGYDFRALVSAVATSDSFRHVREVAP